MSTFLHIDLLEFTVNLLILEPTIGTLTLLIIIYYYSLLNNISARINIFK